MTISESNLAFIIGKITRPVSVGDRIQRPLTSGTSRLFPTDTLSDHAEEGPAHSVPTHRDRVGVSQEVVEKE